MFSFSLPHTLTHTHVCTYIFRYLQIYALYIHVYTYIQMYHTMSWMSWNLKCLGVFRQHSSVSPSRRAAEYSLFCRALLQKRPVHVFRCIMCILVFRCTPRILSLLTSAHTHIHIYARTHVHICTRNCVYVYTPRRFKYVYVSI